MKQVHHNTTEGMPRIKGYFRLGRRYVHQSVILKWLMIGLAAVGVYFILGHAVLMRLYLRIVPMPTLAIDSPYLVEYTGKLRLTDAQGAILYEGEIVSCVPQGTGKVYQRDVLIYEGALEQGMYAGRGTLHTSIGSLLYSGDFLENLYHGRGKLYAADGQLQYEGQFEGGLYEGRGTLYAWRDAQPYRYVGDFSQGVFSGEGKEYEGDALIYEGSFRDGVYDGAGKLYDAGVLIYEGAFAGGVYHGEGKLRQENMRYVGAFAAGLFEGAGKLYEDNILIYEGEFTAGAYSGSGTLYDKQTGHKVFEGRFADGERMQAGTEYDENGEAAQAPPDFIEPLEQFGDAYETVYKALEQAGNVIRPVAAMGQMQWLQDETSGVLYGFAEGGQGGGAQVLASLFVYDITVVDDVMVGMDVGSLAGAPASQSSAGSALSMPAQYVLALSNQLWGTQVEGSALACLHYQKSYGRLTLYYLPPAPQEGQDGQDAAKQTAQGSILLIELTRG